MKYDVSKIMGQEDMVALYQKHLSEKAGKPLSDYGVYETLPSFMTRQYQDFNFDMVLAAITPPPGSSTLNILDVGCGIGCLFGRLEDTFLYRFQYAGIDLVPEFVGFCTSRFQSAVEELTAGFYVGDFLATPPPMKPDVVVMTSIFGLVPDPSFISLCLMRAADLEPRQIILTCNSDEGWHTKQKSNRYSAAEVLRLGQRLGSDVSVRRKKNGDFSCICLTVTR